MSTKRPVDEGAVSYNGRKETSVSRCGEALCEKAIQLLVQGVVACARARSWIPVEQIRSLGARLYAY